MNESSIHSIVYGAAGTVQTLFVKKIIKLYNDNDIRQSCDIDNDEANNNTNNNTNNTESSLYIICEDNHLEEDIKFVILRETIYEMGR